MMVGVYPLGRGGGYQHTILDPQMQSMADLHIKILDARPPLGPIFFIFMRCSANFG